MTKRPKNNKHNKSAPQRHQAKQRTRSGGRQYDLGSDTLKLYGLHAIRAALANPDRKKICLHATENALARLGHDFVAKCGVEVELTESRALDKMVPPDATHQGAVLVCGPLAMLDASELFHMADKKLILMLDQITDPHNVGAILRSATAFGADAVIVTHRNSAQETGALAKAASGAMDMVPVIEVRNLSKALEELNNMRFVSIGLDSEGPLILEETLEKVAPEKAVLVLGSEGKGLREKTRETCHHLARLDMPGAIKSLNVSNAAALSLYVVSKALSR